MDILEMQTWIRVCAQVDGYYDTVQDHTASSAFMLGLCTALQFPEWAAAVAREYTAATKNSPATVPDFPAMFSIEVADGEEG